MYLPYHDVPGVYNDKAIKPKRFQAEGYQFEVGVTFGGDDGDPSDASSGLMAWDPVTQSVHWKVSNPGMWHGGTMVTKGNLVFQGRGDGLLNAYRADNGEKVWEYDAKHGISAPPITFEVDGRQLIALPVGWGGATAMLGGSVGAQHGWVYGMHPRRLLVFELDGKATLPSTPPPMMITPVDDPTFVIDDALVERGTDVWSKTCFWCHGPGAVAAGGAPDLRASGMMFDLNALDEIVLKGQRVARGMPNFGSMYNRDDLISVQHYVRMKARASLKNPQAMLETAD